MWGSKSIIPAAFTYHFTEPHVQCKQRLSLHANERVSRRLHKGPIHSQHGVLAALWIRYPRLQVYSQALCATSLSLRLYNSSLLHKRSSVFGAIIGVMSNSTPYKRHGPTLTAHSEHRRQKRFIFSVFFTFYFLFLELFDPSPVIIFALCRRRWGGWYLGLFT